MTTKEKKQWIIFAVIITITAGIIYFNFLKPNPVSPPVLVGGDPGVANQAIPTGSSSTVTGTTTSTAAPAAFLPNGAKFDLTVLSDERFKILIPPSYPTVTKEEIGKDNPFVR